MSLNKVCLQGNLCRDTELSQTSTGRTFARNTLAVARNYVKEGAERESDFISVIAYGKTAEFLNNHFHKGSPIIISGEIRTGSYDKEDGTKVYTTDVLISEINFSYGDKDTNNSTASENKLKEANVEFTATNTSPLNNDDDLPF